MMCWLQQRKWEGEVGWEKEEEVEKEKEEKKREEKGDISFEFFFTLGKENISTLWKKSFLFRWNLSRKPEV